MFICNNKYNIIYLPNAIMIMCNARANNLIGKNCTSLFMKEGKKHPILVIYFYFCILGFS